ncbi:class I SAM-dependent methyltransferase [Bacteriovorax sp. DB6_IX]|uniref:class I SAM-dependent methyltransferase n=1 Tax=Bacteriovorax sp. DB6_IX TaxID=1353530 RepID=UPI000389E9F1|nr:class I SAM-dependent methyltransferase [Bacteriovorax sp. DB6_IX]EQC50755.1 methyltransferase domain protein [Bacteriovorax sp. DB6_IX]
MSKLSENERMAEYRPGVFFKIPKKFGKLELLIRRSTQIFQALFSARFSANSFLEEDAELRYNHQEELEYYKAVAHSGLTTEELAVLNHLKSRGQSLRNILIVGAGAGREPFYYAKEGYQVDALDINLEMVEAAKNISKESGLDVNFYHGDQSFETGRKYDLVHISFAITSHIQGRKNRVKFFKECFKHVAKDGVMIHGFYDRRVNESLRFRISSWILRMRWFFTKREWEPGDTLISSVGHHNSSDMLSYFYFYESADSIKSELREAGLKGEIIHRELDSNSRLDEFWIIEGN